MGKLKKHKAHFEDISHTVEEATNSNLYFFLTFCGYKIPKKGFYRQDAINAIKTSIPYQMRWMEYPDAKYSMWIDEFSFKMRNGYDLVLTTPIASVLFKFNKTITVNEIFQIHFKLQNDIKANKRPKIEILRELRSYCSSIKRLERV